MPARSRQQRLTGRNCPVCGVAVAGGRLDRRYCSPAHKQAAYRARNRPQRHAPGDCVECDEARRLHRPIPHI